MIAIRMVLGMPRDTPGGPKCSILDTVSAFRPLGTQRNPAEISGPQRKLDRIGSKIYLKSFAKYMNHVCPRKKSRPSKTK